MPKYNNLLRLYSMLYKKMKIQVMLNFMKCWCGKGNFGPCAEGITWRKRAFGVEDNLERIIFRMDACVGGRNGV